MRSKGLCKISRLLLEKGKIMPDERDINHATSEQLSQYVTMLSLLI